MRNPLVTDTTLKMRLVLMLVLAACCWGANVPIDPILDNVEPQTFTAEISDTRLPTGLVPTEYNITLQVFIKPEKNNFTFDGKSEIKLDIVENQIDRITLHAKKLYIKLAELKFSLNGKNNISILEGMSTIDEKDFLIFKLPINMTKEMSDVKLILEYSGKLNDELHGFYKSSYKNSANKDSWLATTQFEPTHAREAFPCWDEPKIKAHFNIIIKNDEAYNALSNTKKIESKIENGVKITSFETTPKMSTYLVAFVISNFENYNTTDEKFNVWAKPHMINSTKFAYDFGKQVLDELDKWTGISYYDKINKMDQISIPDFNAGAMENWGLVTYRESRLLYTEDETTTKDQQNIGTVIAHEFAHQWFGNLVTPEWWDYIWLSEGFATFFQYYIIDQFQPKDKSWRLMEQFVVENVQASSFVTDASIKSRPMNARPSVTTPEQISSLFDNIAYKKAASVIRMIQYFLTDAVFQKGIKNYLKKAQYSSATPTDLFKELSDVMPDKTIFNNFDTFIHNWVNEAGYPVVSVTRTNETDIVLEQNRFFQKGESDVLNAQYYTQWYIPVEYVIQDSAAKIELMNPGNNMTLKVNQDKWILINKDQTGYYRVNYDRLNWNLLAEHLRKNFSGISPVSRAQLIDDALTLARAGYLEYPYSLNITLYLEQEDDYIPWYAAARAFDYLDNLLQDTQDYELFKNYVAHKVKHFADTVKIEEIDSFVSHIPKLAKVLALNMACRYGVDTCEKFAKNKFEEWLSNEENNIFVDYHAPILCAGLRTANIQTFEKILSKYANKNPKEKADILAGLGCMRNESSINEFLQYTFKNNSQINVFEALNSVCQGNLASADLLIKFIDSNFIQIRGRNGEHAESLSQHLNLLARRVKRVNQYEQLFRLVQKNTNIIKDELFEGSGYAKENIAWRSNYKEIVIKWMAENQSNSANSFVLTSFLMIIPVLLMRL